MSPTGLLLINTEAIVSNWRFIVDSLHLEGSTAMSAAVVKADAYGLGIGAVADVLSRSGCGHFFVATLQEAVELRQIVGKAPEIFVLGGLSHGCVDAWLEYRLLPVLFDISHIERWINHCRRINQSLPCVLKVDTGMHRLGMSPSEFKCLLGKKSGMGSLDVRLLMSHLACADDAGHPLNQQQLSAFTECVSLFRERQPQVAYSLANSSGVFLGGDFHFDLVRPGSSLYGINPLPGKANPMRPVVRLILPVMQVRTISAGETVGYGASFRARRETRVAIVFGGYADGLLRALGNSGTGFCNGHSVPVIGRVSMDSMVFDITDLNFLPDTVELLNDTQGVDAVAASAGTIGYEVLTSLGERYQRRYVSAFEPV